eukprot:3932106-Rhodomonas_salina.1
MREAAYACVGLWSAPNVRLHQLGEARGAPLKLPDGDGQPERSHVKPASLTPSHIPNHVALRRSAASSLNLTFLSSIQLVPTAPRLRVSVRRVSPPSVPDLASCTMIPAARLRRRPTEN